MQVPSTTGSSVAARAASTLQDQHAPAAGAPVAEDVLIELRNVHKAFGSKKILRGASFKARSRDGARARVCETRSASPGLAGAVPARRAAQIRRGEAVGIIGGSGTGKSTTLKLAAGLLAPDSGDVVIKGRPRQGLLASRALAVADHVHYLALQCDWAAVPLTDFALPCNMARPLPFPSSQADDADSQHSLKIGLVFQSAALFDSLTVGENVGFLLYEHSKLPEEEIVRRCGTDATRCDT